MDKHSIKRSYVQSAVLLFLLAVIAIVTLACAQTLEYEDFEHIRNWDTDYEPIEDKEDGIFFFYLYAEFCPACAEIKEDVFRFAHDSPRGFNTYFIDMTDIRGEWPINPGKSGVPRMLVIEDGELVDEVVGMFDIPELMAEVRSGDYAP